MKHNHNAEEEATALLNLVAETAVRAGDAIIEVYDSPQKDWQVEHKADDSPLTLADRRAHAVIAGALAATPYPLLSEEGAHADYALRRDYERLWIADPLDGTKEFIKRNGEFTVNIALVEHGRPIFGVVYVPVTRRLCYGMTEEFGGARRAAVCTVGPKGDWKNLETMPLEATGPRPYTVVASRSHLSEQTQAFIDDLRTAHPDLTLRSAGSSLKICLVAEGCADVYPRLAPTMEWDTAAGHAVALGAGCEVVEAETGRPVTYNKEDLHNPFFIVRRPEQ